MFEFSIMRKILSKILLLLVLPISVLSQENDFQTWTSISVSKKIIKKTKTYLSWEPEISIEEGLMKTIEYYQCKI